MKKYWFKAKNYGWGWQPATWQGWAVLAVWALALVLVFHGIDMRSHSGSDTLINFFPRLILLTGSLIIVCWRTGEKPTWRWAGKPTAPLIVLGWTALLIVAFVCIMLAMQVVILHLR